MKLDMHRELRNVADEGLPKITKSIHEGLTLPYTFKEPTSTKLII